VIADIKGWIDARLAAASTELADRSVTAAKMSGR